RTLGRRVGDALRVGVTGGQGERRGGVLAARGAAGGADVLIDLVRAVVHNPDVAGIVGIDRDAGRAGVGRVDGPTAQERAGQRVLEDLQSAAVHHPERRAVGHDVLGIGVAAALALGEAEAAGRALTAGQPAGGAGIVVDLASVAIDQPDI